MSFWIQTKDKDGRGRTLLVDFPVMLPLAVMIALATQLLLLYCNKPTRLGWHGMGLMVGGLTGLAAAKVSLFRRGVWRSWGPHDLTKPYRMVYLVAYSMMGIGLAMAVVYLIGNV